MKKVTSTFRSFCRKLTCPISDPYLHSQWQIQEISSWKNYIFFLPLFDAAYDIYKIKEGHFLQASEDVFYFVVISRCLLSMTQIVAATMVSIKLYQMNWKVKILREDKLSVTMAD